MAVESLTQLSTLLLHNNNIGQVSSDLSGFWSSRAGNLLLTLDNNPSVCEYMLDASHNKLQSVCLCDSKSRIYGGVDYCELADAKFVRLPPFLNQGTMYKINNQLLEGNKTMLSATYPNPTTITSCDYD